MVPVLHVNCEHRFDGVDFFCALLPLWAEGRDVGLVSAGKLIPRGRGGTGLWCEVSWGGVCVGGMGAGDGKGSGQGGARAILGQDEEDNGDGRTDGGAGKTAFIGVRCWLGYGVGGGNRS